MWSLLKAPLFIGADLRKLSKSALKILTAEEVIAVNQDPLGVAGDLIWKEGPIEVNLTFPSSCMHNITRFINVGSMLFTAQPRLSLHRQVKCMCHSTSPTTSFDVLIATMIHPFMTLVCKLKAGFACVRLYLEAI